MEGSGGGDGKKRGPIYNILVGEIQLLMTVMRRNRKWKTDPLSFSKNQSFNANTYVQTLQKLRWSLSPSGKDIDPRVVIKPFVEVVKSEDTTGLATGLAIASLQKLITNHFFDVEGFSEEERLPYVDALAAVVDSLTHCRFESTDCRRDELVLMKMLQAQAACLGSSAGRYLPDKDVWCMIQTCHRVYTVMRPPDYSDLLCEAAESILREMVGVVFSRGNSMVTSPDFKGEGKMSNQPGASLRTAVRVMEFVCSLCSMTATDESANAQTVLLGCQILLSILESNTGDVLSTPQLIKLVEDDVCYFLLSNSTSGNPLIFSLTVRIIYLLYMQMRKKLKIQMEFFFTQIYTRVLEKKQMPYEIKETLLESLLDFSRLPWFFQDLYANFDCQPHCAQICDNLIKLLCRSALPTSSVLTTNHVLALNVLVRVLESIDSRAGEEAPPDKKLESPKGAEHNAGLERKRQLAECIAAFNRKPKAGLQMMREHGFVGSSFLPKDKEADKSFASYMKILGKYQKDLFNKKYKSRNGRKRARVKLVEQGMSVEEAEEKLGPLEPIKHGLMPLPKPDAPHVRREKALESDVKVFVKMIRQSPLFDVEMVGEFLGEPLHLNYLVREAFVDTYNFRGISIDAALRTLLEGFRLPKEAQQIDRCMQSFASAYHRQNEGYMQSEDGVYTLVYSLIMLHTDLHNPLVPKKMSLDQYLINTKDIDDGDDVKRSELERLYKTISTRQIIMTGQDPMRQVSPELWKDSIHLGELFESGVYRDIEPARDDKAVFETIWKPMLSVLSVVYGMAKQEQVMKLVEQGYMLLFKLASQFERKDILEAAFSSLCEHTGLLEEVKGAINQDSLVRFAANPGALHAVKILVTLVGKHGRALNDGWSRILRCLVRLHRMDVLPTSVLSLNDFVPGVRSRADILNIKPVRFQEPQEEDGMVSSLLKGVSYYFLPPVSDTEEHDEQVRKLHLIAKDFTDKCHIDSVIPATSKVDSAALKCLLGDIGSMCDVSALADELCAMCWHNTVYTSARLKHAQQLQQRSGTKRSKSTPALSKLSHSGSEVKQDRGRIQSEAPTPAIAAAKEPEDEKKILVSASDIFKVIAMNKEVMTQIFQAHEREEKENLQLWLKDKSKRGVIIDPSIEASKSQYWVWEHGWIPNRLRESLLLVHFFTQITLHNKHRIRLILPEVKAFLSKLVRTQKRSADGKNETKGKNAEVPHAVAEAAVASIVAISSQMLENKETADIGLEMISMLLEVDHKRGVLVAEQLTFGLEHIVTQHRTKINVVADWQAILELVGRGVKHVATVISGLRILTLLVTDTKCPALSLHNFRTTTSTVLKYGLGLKEHSAALRCVDLLFVLHRRLSIMLESNPKLPETFLEIARKDKSEGGDEYQRAVWLCCWRPLLSALCTLCLRLPVHFCTHALHVFQQLLLSHGLPGKGSSVRAAGEGEKTEDAKSSGGAASFFWKHCMNDVLLPFLKDLGQRKSVKNLNQIRQRALNLMTKIFLQRLHTFVHEKSFHLTLVNVINAIQQYMLIGKSDTLSEMALETLKNLILVMSSTGVFLPEQNPTGKELWDLTWAHIDPVCPNLREELFPDKQSMLKADTATTAPKEGESTIVATQEAATQEGPPTDTKTL